MGNSSSRNSASGASSTAKPATDRQLAIRQYSASLKKQDEMETFKGRLNDVVGQVQGDIETLTEARDSLAAIDDPQQKYTFYPLQNALDEARKSGEDLENWLTGLRDMIRIVFESYYQAEDKGLTTDQLKQEADFVQAQVPKLNNLARELSDRVSKFDEKKHLLQNCYERLKHHLSQKVGQLRRKLVEKACIAVAAVVLVVGLVVGAFALLLQKLPGIDSLPGIGACSGFLGAVTNFISDFKRVQNELSCMKKAQEKLTSAICSTEVQSESVIAACREAMDRVNCCNQEMQQNIAEREKMITTMRENELLLERVARLEEELRASQQNHKEE